MSSILDFFKSLLPRVEKDDVMDSILAVDDLLEKIVIPAYRQMVPVFSDGFKSKEAKTVNDFFLKELGIRGAKTFLPKFAEHLEFMHNNLDVLKKEVQAELGRDVVVDGATSRKIMLIRVVSNFEFCANSALALTNYLLSAEKAEIDGGDVMKDLNPMEVREVVDASFNLAKLVPAYGVPSDKFQKILDGAIDVHLSKNDQTSENLYRETELDPITPPGLKNFRGNPIYMVRMSVSEWRKRRYDAAKDRKKLLELRILDLEQLREGSSNPALEKEITFWQGKVSKLEKYIREQEEVLD